MSAQDYKAKLADLGFAEPRALRYQIAGKLPDGGERPSMTTPATAMSGGPPRLQDLARAVLV
jgi:hypothetical protein